MRSRPGRILFVWILLLALNPGDGFAGESRPLRHDEGISALGTQLWNKQSDIGQKMIAVVDFTTLKGETTDLGAFLADALASSMSLRGARLVERRLLMEAVRELQLNNMTDLVDPMRLKRFGRFTGTEILVMSVITEFPESLKINTKLVDLETLAVMATGEVLIQKDRDMKKLLGEPYPGKFIIRTRGNSDVYLNEVLVSQTDFWGNLTIEPVKPGSYTIMVKKDGYQSQSKSIDLSEGQELRMEFSLSPYPSPALAGTLSFFLPGAGDLYLGHDDWWLFAAGVGGSIYGAIYYSKKTDELISVTDDTGKSHLERRGKDPVYGFAALAGIIWIYDIQHVVRSAKTLRYFQAEGSKGDGVILMPDKDGVRLMYRWEW